MVEGELMEIVFTNIFQLKHKYCHRGTETQNIENTNPGVYRFELF